MVWSPSLIRAALTSLALIVAMTSEVSTVLGPVDTASSWLPSSTRTTAVRIQKIGPRKNLLVSIDAGRGPRPS